MRALGAAACGLVALTGAGAASAQDCMMGTLQLFAGNFAPRGYYFADGSVLPIAQNTALFSILGTTYGGDGTSTFALPDLRGRAPVQPGQGPGLPQVVLGQAYGAASTTLTVSQMPSHSHDATTTTAVQAVSAAGDLSAPAGASLANDGNDRIYSAATPDVKLSPSAAASQTVVAPAGGGQPIPTQSPALGINYILCAEGIYPSRP